MVNPGLEKFVTKVLYARMRCGIYNSAMMWLRLAVIGLLWVSSLAAQEKEQSVGLVLSSDGARLVRVNSELALKAKAGDILFPGDSLQGEGGTVSFLFCPEKSSQTLSQDGEVVFEADKLRVEQGELVDRKEVSFCILPQLERSPSASQQHYRDTLTRSLDITEGETASFESRLQELPASDQDALRAELEPIDQALSQDSDDQAARLARAAILQKYGLSADAIEEYEKISGAWEDADWVRALVHEEASEMEPEEAGEDGPGETYALLVGISEYQRLTEEQQLQFAHADAETFEEYLLSPRGGGLPEENIERLTNQEATTAAIRVAIESFLKTRAGRNDTLILFMAAHGTVAKTPDGPQAFIITYDSDPQDLASTALPMADIQALMRDQLSKVGRVMVYVDVCRAGMIGTIKSNTVNRNMEELFEEEGDLFGFLASRPKEYSIESARFGGGHGAFTYFLLRALNGDADDINETGNGDGFVSVNEVIDYVRDKVREATRNKQHPTERVSFLDDLELADIEADGILLSDWTPAPESERKTRFLAAVTLPDAAGMSAPKRRRRQATVDDIVLFEDALEAGRVLPETAESAFEPLRRLQRRLSKEDFLLLENRLRVALEDRGQQVLLRYLSGDQIPQTRSSFASGALYFGAAQVLTPDSPFLKSREAFSRGRMLIFDKQYDEAIEFLERAVRLDPKGAYSYNALGIAYLEQSDFSHAIQAFRDANRRAPYWAYPLHNLALAYTEIGDYQGAIRAYEEAMVNAPQYSYLPYNLGLVYQRLNRRNEAEEAYREAIALTPDLAEPYNALGVLYASRGRASQSEGFYRQALEKNPDLLAARHNLALLLAENQGRAPEAIDLWRENISRQEQYLPSRLVLAETLDRQGAVAEAMAEYRAVLSSKPDFVGARMALAGLLARSGNPDDAVEQLQEALQRKPRSPLVYEQLGDIEMARGRTAEARAAYESALENAADPKARKTIRSKLKQ